MSHTYDEIGKAYARYRAPDPRIGAQILAALGSARHVVNVGAGSGSYEPDDRFVVGVEPSETMMVQRRGGFAVRAVAEALPFPDASFDAALAVLTVHHWTDEDAGLAEMRRVAPHRQVVLTWDPRVFAERCWLVRDYLPEIVENEAGSASVDAVSAGLGSTDIRPVRVPHDCTDGFLAAYWRRPERYLEPGVRRSISGLALLDPDVRDAAMARLADDLRSGAWVARHEHLLGLDTYDFGYRLVVGGNTRDVRSGGRQAGSRTSPVA